MGEKSINLPANEKVACILRLLVSVVEMGANRECVLQEEGQPENENC